VNPALWAAWTLILSSHFLPELCEIGTKNFRDLIPFFIDSHFLEANVLIIIYCPQKLEMLIHTSKKGELGKGIVERIKIPSNFGKLLASFFFENLSH
jgi:hypothetical protein